MPSFATQADIEAAVTAAEAAVAASTTVDDSAATLLSQLNALWQAALNAGGTPQAIVDRMNALVGTLGAHSTTLADSVTVNTPAA